MKVYIIRHGESQNNKDGLWTGWFDAPLTEKGKEDAARVSALLGKIKFDKIYSSDLSRARHTAEIAAAGCAYETSELLREIDVGSLTGTKISLLDEALRLAISKMGYAEFGGESRAAFSNRIADFQKKLEGLDCDTVAIFCHGGWLRTFIERVIEVNDLKGKLICKNCAVGVFEFNGKTWKLNSFINLDAIM